jgi:hypothetical protein
MEEVSKYFGERNPRDWQKRFSIAWFSRQLRDDPRESIDRGPFFCRICESFWTAVWIAFSQETSSSPILGRLGRSG